MSSSNVIYALSLNDKVYRYVGLTTRGARRRLNRHLCDANRGSQLPVHRWIRKHGVNNITVTILETSDNPDTLASSESSWILKLREDGYPLLNCTYGGEMGSMLRKPSICSYIEEDSNYETGTLNAFIQEEAKKALEEYQVELQQYAVDVAGVTKRRKKCLTCALDPDVVRQINDARKPQDGKTLIPFSTIAKWLEHETGTIIQPNTIRNHFVAGHDRDQS